MSVLQEAVFAATSNSNSNDGQSDDDDDDGDYFFTLPEAEFGQLMKRRAET